MLEKHSIIMLHFKYDKFIYSPNFHIFAFAIFPFLMDFLLELVVGILSTIVGGLILVVVLFFFHEKIFPTHDFSGEWDLQTVTRETSYNKFKDLTICWRLHLIHYGREIHGSGEKIWEQECNKEKYEYERKNRIRAQLKGYYHKRYFGPDLIVINSTEHGHLRESITTINLYKGKSGIVKGSFSSTAADSKGEVSFKRYVG
ncbi:MAG: hypothetical protein SFW35_07660 [Chitinophagales bacterium]|nr:hypothetical protein [Chitinophagales bacterium]